MYVFFVEVSKISRIDWILLLGNIGGFFFLRFNIYFFIKK